MNQPSEGANQSASPGPNKKRRRGSRGGRNRNKSGQNGQNARSAADAATPSASVVVPAPAGGEPPRRPQIGDTRPAPARQPAAQSTPAAPKQGNGKRRRGGRGRSRSGSGQQGGQGGRQRQSQAAVEAEIVERRRGRTRDGRPVGRYLMCVQVREGLTQVAVLEGRKLIEHYVSRPADDVSQIHGNIYLCRVQNVLPGMEAAFVDIATPKNAVLYRGDVQYDAEDIVEKSTDRRIEDILKARQLILCQVTKNPIGAKGARLTQEVSLPGRFVVLIPNSKTYGISKRLPDDERRRLRSVLDRVKPAEHGLIVRTA
ncbi:MAG: ribonuclease E/G, partial [Actinomycetota bacterium]